MPRRVLLVTELFPPAVGGSSELFRNVYSRLADSNVTVLCDYGDGGGVIDPPLPASVAVVRDHVKATRWGVLGRGALSHHLRSARRIRQLSAGSVVHCGRVLPEGIAAMAARSIGGSPYICWAHGEELMYADSSRELRAILRVVIRRASALIANSQNTADVLKRLGASADAIHVIYPGVDADRFRPDATGAAALRRQLAADDELVLLTVGRLQRRKGHDLVIKSLPDLLRRSPGLRYVIAGDGEERQALESLATELGVRDRVTFVGRVSNTDLPAYYAAADLFVHPNRTDGADFEGFGIVFLEAAAAGLAVVGGTTGGAPEAIAEGETGALVSGVDVDELTACVGRLLANPALRRELGGAGRRRVCRDFSWESAAQRLRVVCERVEAA